MVSNEKKKNPKEERSIMGINLMNLRKAHRLTQEEVARIIQVKRSTYAYYERGIVPSPTNIKRLATLFDIDIEFLIYGKKSSAHPFIFTDSSLNLIDLYKLFPLKKDESFILAHFRLLNKKNKEKVANEIVDLYNKQSYEEENVMSKILVEMRKAHRLTQEEVARIIQVKRSTYAYYENGIIPSPENIKRLATLFDVSVHYLMYGVEEPIYGTPPINIKTDINTLEIQKLKDIKKEEAPILSHFRLLSLQNKEKIANEIIDLYNKQF